MKRREEKRREATAERESDGERRREREREREREKKKKREDAGGFPSIFFGYLFLLFIARRVVVGLSSQLSFSDCQSRSERFIP